MKRKETFSCTNRRQGHAILFKPSTNKYSLCSEPPLRHFLVPLNVKHAPIRIKRVGKKNPPWVTGELRRLLFERDSLKKRAAKSGDASLWHQYKQFRNRANNEVKRAKRLYFTNNLELHKHDMKKTWKLINDLNSRHCRTSSYIKEVKIARRSNS